MVDVNSFFRCPLKISLNWAGTIYVKIIMIEIKSFENLSDTTVLNKLNYILSNQPKISFEY